MEDYKKKSSDVERNEKEIVYSQAIKAGKRIYYLDVKRNRKDELFLAITESKKVVTGEGDDSQINFEKHKLFLYKEDMDKFLRGLQQAVNYIHSRQEWPQTRTSEPAEEVAESEAADSPINEMGEEIKIDIDF